MIEWYHVFASGDCEMQFAEGDGVMPSAFRRVHSFALVPEGCLGFVCGFSKVLFCVCVGCFGFRSGLLEGRGMSPLQSTGGKQV